MNTNEYQPQIDLLEEQILEKRQEILTEKISMSIGELTSMYEAQDLIIRPAFQRLFRWDNEQKTRLIESILLRIPIPPLFVSTTKEGRWEVIDGLQRVSTLLQLQGLLLNEHGTRAEPLRLGGTTYLPMLEDINWDGPGHSFSDGQRRDILRARIDLNIISRGSDPKAKFDLFQRLNSLGSPLTPQEIRNAMLHSMNQDVAEWILKLSEWLPFNRFMTINDRQKQSAYSQELVLRFLALHDSDPNDLGRAGFLNTVLDNYAVKLCEMDPEALHTLDSTFKTTFDYLSTGTEEKLLNIVRDGVEVDRFSITSFEVLALGVGFWAAEGKLPSISASELDQEFRHSGFEVSSSGKSAEQRMKKTIPFGRDLISNFIAAE